MISSYSTDKYTTLQSLWPHCLFKSYSCFFELELEIGHPICICNGKSSADMSSFERGPGRNQKLESTDHDAYVGAFALYCPYKSEKLSYGEFIQGSWTVRAENRP